MKNFLSSKILPCIVAITLLISGCKKDDVIVPEYVFSSSESDSINIAVYLDQGVWDICKTTTESMLKEMKCHYTVFNKDSILYGNLQRYDLFLMPGSDMWILKNYLESAGMEKIKAYVNQGGGYFGICGGAYFAATTNTWRGWAGSPRNKVIYVGLNLFSGVADGPIEDFAPAYMDSKCVINIVEPNHPITRNVPQILEMYYDHGPMFLLNEDAEVTILGKTENGNKDVIMAFQYGSGNVFLSSLHPERDETHKCWLMVKNAIIWCAAK